MFGVGEECIYIGPRDDLVGSLVVIYEGPLSGLICRPDRTRYFCSKFYRIRFLDGSRPAFAREHWAAEPSHLKRQDKYDGNVKTSWSDLIVWKPKEVVTV